jgi:hypothetical protein
MELNVDELISFYNKALSLDNKLDLDEQEEESSSPEPSSSTPPPPASSSGGASGGGGNSGKTPRKWESGASRGKANPTANTVWSSGRQLGRTYMNDPKHVWNSGVQRGKANSLYYD